MRPSMCPNLGDLKAFRGSVPVPGGVVEVSADEREIRVRSEIPGERLGSAGSHGRFRREKR